jgi:signal transduction histidine kinase
MQACRMTVVLCAARGYCAVRMVQESLNNIAKHAQATRVDVMLDDTDDEIMLTVRDNGVGIPQDRPGNVMHAWIARHA